MYCSCATSFQSTFCLIRLLHVSASAIKCYSCYSENNGKCADPFDATTANALEVTCSWTTLDPTISKLFKTSITEFECYKAVSVNEVIRGCAPAADAVCDLIEGTVSDSECHNCDSDLCNRSSTYYASITFLLSSLVWTLFKLF